MVKELEVAKKRIEELKELIKYDHEVILNKILENSVYLESVKEEVNAYRIYKQNIDNFAKIADKINSIRDELLDFTEVNFPQLYDDFVKDVYDEDVYESLIFIRAVFREIIKE